MDKQVLITGSIRSGTTLAFKQMGGDPDNDANEPDAASRAIVARDWAAAERAMRDALNRHGLVKSPHAAFLPPNTSRCWDVVVTIRPLRQIVGSILNYKPSLQQEMAGMTYWTPLTEPYPNDIVYRAAACAFNHYLSIFSSHGLIRQWHRISVLYYGEWDEWGEGEFRDSNKWLGVVAEHQPTSKTMRRIGAMEKAVYEAASKFPRHHITKDAT